MLFYYNLNGILYNKSMQMCWSIQASQNQQIVCGEEIYFHVSGSIVMLHLYFVYFQFFTSTFPILIIYKLFLASR